MQVSAIAIYPVKACAQVPLRFATVEARGIRGDRRWVIVDETGRFVSQREIPALARLAALQDGAVLRLSLDSEAHAVETPAADTARQPVTVWKSRLHLAEAPAAADWLTRHFGRPLRLFHQPDDVVRPTDPEWGQPGDQVSMADGFPLLLTTTAALAAVERSMAAAVELQRFRPNLVIDGAGEGDDDGWASVRIGDVVLDIVKPCARCIVTTVDQTRGVVTGEEPLATLRRTRISGERRVPGFLFGWNAVPRQLGSIRLGDAVQVLARRDPWPIRHESPPVEA